MVPCLLLDVQHSLFHQDDVVSGIGIAAAVKRVVGAVGHKGFAGQLPYPGFPVLVLAVLIHGFAFPEWEKLLSHDFLVFIGDIEWVLWSCSDGVNLILHPSPCDIR